RPGRVAAAPNPGAHARRAGAIRHLLLLASLLAAVLAVLAVRLPGCTAPPGWRFPGLFAPPSAFEDEHPQAAADPVPQTVQSWEADKNKVIDDLLARRLTLPQAVARFREINNQIPHYPWHIIEDRDPRRTPEENVGRWVIDWIRSTLAERGQDTALADPLQPQLHCPLQ